MTVASSPPGRAPGLVRFDLPAPDLLTAVAARVLDVEGAAGVRDAVIVVPDLHAVGDVGAALRAASRRSVVLLPAIVTLRSWAEEVTLDTPVLGDAARAALIYGALEGRSWLAGADLWQIAGEVARLFDELTRERLRLAAAPAEFVAWLRAAYGARDGASLDFEARLVHDLWTAFATDRTSLDRENAYVARLARLAADATRPLHVFGLQQPTRAESEFLAAYAQRAPVYLYASTLEATADPAVAAVAAAWSSPERPLRERAAALRAAQPTSGLAERVSIAGATSPEHEAQIVDLAVRVALLEDRGRVAVVVQDRVTARRARAMLERAGVLVSDEAGWAMSTTSAATVLARWLDAVSGQFHHRDLLDLLKSPFVFADWSRDARRAAVWRLERTIRDANVVAGLERYIALADEAGDAEVRQMLATLRTAAAPLQRRRAGLARWLTLLLDSLATLGVVEAWRADAAGAQLLDLLEQLQEELRGENLQLTYGEWRQWLGAQLDNAAFRDRSVTSPAVFTYLDGTGLRRFDTVIVVGADAAHLPAPEAASPFFNDGVRAQLGLTTRATAARLAERRLAELVAGARRTIFTWQAQSDGEPNLLSPLLERLEAMHVDAYGTSLADEALGHRALLARVRDATASLPAVTGMPAPIIAASLLPQTMSASGHHALMACPYQFYARHVLRLGELDDVQELIDKSDYGIVLHDALAQFHRAHPVVSELPAADATVALERISEAVFAPAIARNYLARAWLARWRLLIPRYLDWQRQREAAGWRFHAAEETAAVTLTTPAGRTLTLRGRLDRVDRHLDDRIALLDYKTQRREKLKEKASADGEDVQLPVYALLWPEPAAEAQFVAIDGDVAGYPLAADPPVLAAAVRDRLTGLYDAMHDGAALPAHGVEAVCEYCEVAGLCRRQHWS